MNKYFKRREFECKCGCGFASVDAELLEVLTRLREWADGPIKITSGNRCKIHNTNVGGEKGSYHTKGMAADIQVEDKSPFEVSDILDEWYPDEYGIGRYSTWTHIDVREDKSRWSK